MKAMQTEAIILKSRPQGRPNQDNFSVKKIELPQVKRGQILIRTRYYTVDPYMRGRMNDQESYVPPFEVGDPLDGGVVGRVEESAHPDFAVGDLVVSQRGGWQRHSVIEAHQGVEKITDSPFDPEDYLGAAGMPGLTAYAGLFEVGRPRPGDHVFVSAASGAVGSLVAQFAKLAGCKVFGAAGSDKKISYLLDDLKLDGAFNYKKTDSVKRSFQEVAPDGLDLYWDNVGGDFLEAALASMRPNGVIVSCGMISIYNDETPPPGPRNMAQMIGKQLRMQGFLVFNYFHLMDRYLARLAAWKKSGAVSWETTKVKGLEKGIDAFLGLFEGDNIGKMVVEVD